MLTTRVSRLVVNLLQTLADRGVLLLNLSVDLLNNNSSGVDLVGLLLVGDGVLARSKLGSRDGRADDGLDLGTVDDASKIGVGHEGTGKVVLRLGQRTRLVVTIDGSKLAEGTFSEDDEATEGTTRGELEKVQAINAGDLNTREVADSLDDAVVLTVDDEGTLASNISATTSLTNTAADVLGILSLLDISDGTNLGEDLDSLLGLSDRLNRVGENERDLLDGIDLVTTSHDDGRDGRSSKSSSDGMTLGSLVGVSVPTSPGLEGVEHTSTTALVTESTLSGTMGTTTGNTGNTSNSATSTPGLSRGLITSVGSNTVSLTTILVHVGVNNANEVGADGSRENSRKTDLSGLLVLGELGHR